MDVEVWRWDLGSISTAKMSVNPTWCLCEGFELCKCQATSIYTALFSIQSVSKLLHRDDEK